MNGYGFSVWPVGLELAAASRTPPLKPQRETQLLARQVGGVISLMASCVFVHKQGGELLEWVCFFFLSSSSSTATSSDVSWIGIRGPLFHRVVALVLAGLPRQHKLPGRGEEQLHPSDRGPLHQGEAQPVAPEGGAQAGAVWLPGYVLNRSSGSGRGVGLKLASWRGTFHTSLFFFENSIQQ